MSRFTFRATPWFDYLMVSPGELAELLEGTGWTTERILEGQDTYVAVIGKTAAPSKASPLGSALHRS